MPPMTVRHGGEMFPRASVGGMALLLFCEGRWITGHPPDRLAYAGCSGSGASPDSMPISLTFLLRVLRLMPRKSAALIFTSPQR